MTRNEPKQAWLSSSSIERIMAKEGPQEASIIHSTSSFPQPICHHNPSTSSSYPVSTSDDHSEMSSESTSVAMVSTLPNATSLDRASNCPNALVVSLDGPLRGQEKGSQHDNNKSKNTGNGYNVESNHDNNNKFMNFQNHSSAGSANINSNSGGSIRTDAEQAVDCSHRCSESSSSGYLDPFLLTALNNRHDRLFLLKLDRDFCNFIQDPNQTQLEFPWLNSYYRMIIHRSAIYFQLARK
ncbi:hypothetical protein BX616_006088, partial [Lobosporangium transversale]